MWRPVGPIGCNEGDGWSYVCGLPVNKDSRWAAYCGELNAAGVPCMRVRRTDGPFAGGLSLIDHGGY